MQVDDTGCSGKCKKSFSVGVGFPGREAQNMLSSWQNERIKGVMLVQGPLTHWPGRYKDLMES